MRSTNTYPVFHSSEEYQEHVKAIKKEFLAEQQVVPNPNEVMDVEDTGLAKKIDDLIIKHNRYIDSVWRGEADPTKPPHTVADILALIAQQNAALLREIKSKGARLMITDVEHIVIPMNVFDAKLKEITKEVKI